MSAAFEFITFYGFIPSFLALIQYLLHNYAGITENVVAVSLYVSISHHLASYM